MQRAPLPLKAHLTMTTPALPALTASLYVALGGGIGALARYQVGRAVTHAVGGGAAFPWATFAVNVIGSLAMGLLFGWLARSGGASEGMRLALGVGLLGGFTTFSAFSLELVQLIQRGAPGMAAAYVAASVLAGAAALYIGLLIMRGAA